MDYRTQQYLYHHGIKGQKWGVRRFQYKDGSLTPAGRKRYAEDSELGRQKSEMEKAKLAMQESKKKYNQASNKAQLVPTKKNWDEYEKAIGELHSNQVDYRTKRLRYRTNKEVARIKDKGVTFEKKSKHRLDLEEKYKQLGMSDEQAEAAANNRIRTEKIVAASAAMTVAACALYVANNVRKDRIDGIINAGDTLQRIEMQDTGGKLHDMFYVAKDSHDVKRYKNLLGYSRQQQTGEAYVMQLQAASSVKVASKDRAVKTFGELYKTDREFRQSVGPFVERHFGGGHVVGNTSNLSDRNMKKMYENFNANLIAIRENGSGVDKKFYDKLKSLGYGAIQDINDMKYSGYNAKNPLIVFDNSKGNIMVQSVSKITEDLSRDGQKELLLALGEGVAKDALEFLGPATAATLSAAAVAGPLTDPTSEYKKRKGTSKW